MTDEIPSPEEMARRLTHAARYAAVGKVAAGAAHEINQPLNVIRMAAFNIRRAIQKDRLNPESAIEKLEKIDVQIDRAARLVGGMKAFSPTSASLRTSVKPSESIAVALELMAKRFTSGEVLLDHQATDVACEVQAEPTAMQELVINLVENALEAYARMPASSAEVSSDAPNQEPVQKSVVVTEAIDGSDFVLTVSDTAGGMTADVLARAAEPFFTTCTDGSHPGLGLSICHDVASHLDGALTVNSREQGGTTVSVRFPVDLSPTE